MQTDHQHRLEVDLKLQMTEVLLLGSNRIYLVDHSFGSCFRSGVLAFGIAGCCI